MLLRIKSLPFFLASFLGLLPTDGEACIRIDLNDRTPEVVAQKSVYLAQNNDHSNVTGAVIVKTEEDLESQDGSFSKYGSGIALDRYTVLTTAHYIHTDDSPKQLLFTLNPKPLARDAGTKYYKVAWAAPHPTFSMLPPMTKPVTFKDGEPYLEGTHLGSLTYPMVEEGPHKQLRGFSGVDITILKLEEPLPETLIFPEIMPIDQEIKNTYGISLGYGRMFYNNQEKGPIRVVTDQRESIVRHLVSSKVTTYESEDKGPLLYGSYKGLMIHGSKSFIPDASMLKTEGFCVQGDSGGPLFIQHNGKYKLVGICSYSWSAMDAPIEDQKLAQMLRHITQPIFPVCVDIRKHMEDIQQFMGEEETTEL